MQVPKTLLIVGLNQDYRAILTPILATVLDVIISRNVAHSRKRKTPLFCSFDEIPSIKLPKLANWLAEARSAGFVGSLGLQNKSQLNETYGEDRSNTIMANCATKNYLNPQDVGSAKEYSEYLGEHDVIYWTKSIASGAGNGGKSTVTKSEQRSKVPLMSPEEFLKLPQGKAVTISSAYGNENEAYVPILHNILIDPADVADSKRSVGQWESIIAAARANKTPLTNESAAAMMAERRAIVERLFPEPPETKVKARLEFLVGVALTPRNGSEFQLAANSQNYDPNLKVDAYSEWTSIGASGKPEMDAYKVITDDRLYTLLATHGITIERTDRESATDSDVKEKSVASTI